MTTFIVNGSKVERGAKLDKMGMRGSNTGELIFDGTFVPDGDVLGKGGGGAQVREQERREKN